MTKIEPGIFRVAVAAVIVNDKNFVLLTQRSPNRDHHALDWEIMSGRLNQGESFEEALAREAYEELQIKLEIICPLKTFHFFRGEALVEHVGLTFLAKHVGGEVVVDGEEEVAYEWLDIDQAIARVKDKSILQNLMTAKEYLNM